MYSRIQLTNYMLDFKLSFKCELIVILNEEKFVCREDLVYEPRCLGVSVKQLLGVGSFLPPG